MRFDKRPKQANIRHASNCFCVKVCVVMRTIIVMEVRFERNRAGALVGNRHVSSGGRWPSCAPGALVSVLPRTEDLAASKEDEREQAGGSFGDNVGVDGSGFRLCLVPRVVVASG